MKCRWIYILTLLYAGAAFTASESQQYDYTPGHVSFVVPAEWRIIPIDELETYKRKLGETFPGRPVPNYVAGMQRKALFTFELPYVLVEIEQRSMPSLEEIQAEKLSYAGNIHRAYLSLHRKGMFGEVKAMPAEYYPDRKVLLGYSEMTRARDKVRLAAITAVYPCQYGYLRMHFFINIEHRDRDMQAVDEIISSVSFDEPYSYVPHNKDVSSNRPRNILYGSIAALACGWGIVRVIGWRMKKREPFQR